MLRLTFVIALLFGVAACGDAASTDGSAEVQDGGFVDGDVND